MRATERPRAEYDPADVAAALAVADRERVAASAPRLRVDAHALPGWGIRPAPKGNRPKREMGPRFSGNLQSLGVIEYRPGFGPLAVREGATRDSRPLRLSDD